MTLIKLRPRVGTNKDAEYFVIELYNPDDRTGGSFVPEKFLQDYEIVSNRR